MKNFFETLIKKHRIPEKELKKLLGEAIGFDNGGSADVIARVNDVKKNKLHYEIIEHPFHGETNHPSRTGEIEVFYLSEKAYSFDDGKKSYTIDAYEVHKTPPKGLAFILDLTEFQIFPNDKYLPTILNDLKKHVGEIKSKQGLADLANYLKKKLRFSEKRDDSLDTKLSLGEVVNKEGVVCRHLAGIIHAYLLMQNIDSDILGTKKPVNEEAHSFLKVYLPKQDYLVDPSLGLVMPYSTSKEEMKKMKKSTKYHFPNRKSKVEFLY